MSLQVYKIEFSPLSPNERKELFDRINRFSYTGLKFSPDLQSGEFTMDELYSFEFLEIPENCHLTQILQV